MDKLKNSIKELARKYAKNLENKVDNRIEEMKSDNTDHHLIYRVLGIDTPEGEKIDIYQNKGRFLYKYAGSFLEDATILCFKYKYGNNLLTNFRIENTRGNKPKKFEIDVLVNNRAYEIKWRDATTDGDHITKEHTRVLTSKDHGYTPVRIMFYYPNREQSKRVQTALQALYKGEGGEYYFGDNAWKYIRNNTGVDLLNILEEIAIENTSK